tara:strand:+ start:325 stop:519 length:195 start_codon:yes stop_codon:yes gene_type:complete
LNCSLHKLNLIISQQQQQQKKKKKKKKEDRKRELLLLRIVLRLFLLHTQNVRQQTTDAQRVHDL